MGPKKRKAKVAPKRNTPTRKQKEDAANGADEVDSPASISTPHPSADDSTTPKSIQPIIIDIDSVYTQCTVGHYYERRNVIYSLEERGMVETLLWPACRVVSSVSKDSKMSSNSTSTFTHKHAFVMTLLVNCKASTTGTPFSFMSAIPNNHQDDVLAFDTFLELLLSHPIQQYDLQAERIHFFSHCVASTTTTNAIAMAIQKITSISIWHSMSSRKREYEFAKHPPLKEAWMKQEAQQQEQQGIRTFIPNLVDTFLQVLYSPLFSSKTTNDDDDNNSEDDYYNKEQHRALVFLHRTLEFFTDLLSTPSTRSFVRTFLLYKHFAIRCMSSPLVATTTTNTTHRLFRQLLDMYLDVEQFAVDAYDSTKALSAQELQNRTHESVHILQRFCYKYFSNRLTDFAFAGVNLACTRNFLLQHLSKLSTEELFTLAYKMRLVDNEQDDEVVQQRSFLLAVLVYHHIGRRTEAMLLSSLPIYPNEKLLWDGNVVPPGNIPNAADKVLALPKLNLQFLTFQDYLLRSFKLVRLESAYEIRADLVDAVRRVDPVLRYSYQGKEEEDEKEMGEGGDAHATTVFKGWARMAMELASFRFIKIAPPNLGEIVPSAVIAEIVLDLKPLGWTVRAEWDELREHDNLFLVTLDASKMTRAPAPLLAGLISRDGVERRVPDEEDTTFPQRFGVMCVRGCMVLEMRDEAGVLLNDPAASHHEGGGRTIPQGTKRFLKVSLDPSQFAADVDEGKEVYQGLNLVVRRKGKENNFKAVLETVRGLMKTNAAAVNRCVPVWLHDVLLGYADASSANYNSERMKKYSSNTVGVTPLSAALDFGDTFIDVHHLQESFKGYEIAISNCQLSEQEVRNNFKLKFLESGANFKIEATPYDFPSAFVGNQVRFTPVQVEAVRSGLSSGLTMIIGPPGSGKTDVAVQIIANLFHSFPSQRTIIITHSNAALNDLFEKVMLRGDIEERYMIRLGSGERDLQTSSDHDFTKGGRVLHSLHRREMLLEAVQCLSESLGVSTMAERGANGEPSYNCQSAEYFHLHHVLRQIQIFEKKLKAFRKNDDDELHLDSNVDVADIFPFKKYFSVENSLSLKDAFEKVASINQIFIELSEYRPLELLRSQRQRTDYLLTKQARIVAMTCTHAAIARSHLIELSFQYDNIVMEEAGQMLEIETFVPFLLQKGEADETDTCRLKRVCLIGDHHQLPPVVKNIAFQKFSHLDQSLFFRLIRLGVPYVQLNSQGRSRAEIAKLYSWRYTDLGNLEHVQATPAYKTANAGFVHSFQLIDVPDFEGRGESTPAAYYYQNLGEAEYVVALFQYMVSIL